MCVCVCVRARQRRRRRFCCIRVGESEANKKPETDAPMAEYRLDFGALSGRCTCVKANHQRQCTDSFQLRLYKHSSNVG